ncbi:hypothetical protein ACODT4_44510 [Streptomyces sp. 2.9]|uniref:hypothetical protein n=1 Tax=Streptomyces tritrimontium TaxID=3406573 RepID=UPI003BB68137
MSRTRGTWNTKGTWLAGVMLAAVVLLTGYAALGGDGGDGQSQAKGGEATPSASAPVSPQPTYEAPEDWTEPKRWMALPRGQRTDGRGSQVGYPQTAEGAVAMMAAANTTRVEGDHSTVDEQLRIYSSYIAKGDQSSKAAEQIEMAATKSDEALANEMGIAVGQPLPSGAYVRTHVIGYKIIKKAGDEVGVWLLIRGVQKDGEMAEERGSYTRTLAGAQWQDGEWKLTAAATVRAQQEIAGKTSPAMAAPGDPEFNSAGWTAIREAS